MKNFWITAIVGFIAGLVISGILFDVISYVGKSFNRVSVAWTISRAEKSLSSERFSDAILLYDKALAKIDVTNKTLYAKTKNNLALSISKNAEVNKDIKSFEKALKLFQEAQIIYLEIDNKELAEQTNKNIQIVKELIKSL